MAGSEFLQRFRAVLLATLLLPLAYSFLIVGFLSNSSAIEMMDTLRQAAGFYTVTGAVLVYLLLDHFMATTVTMAMSGDEAAHGEAEKRIGMFSYLFGVIFSLYALTSPVMVNMSLTMHLGASMGLVDHLFAIIGVLPLVAVTVLIVLYAFSDLAGQFFGPRGFAAHFFSLRMKVVALALVMPLVVDTGMILYFGHRAGDMGFDMFIVWGAFLIVSLPVAYFAQHSFNKSFGPLKKLRAQALNALDDFDSIIDPVPVSLDEFGDVTRDWASLTQRMTKFWRDLNNTTDHYRTLINAMDEAIAIVDHDTRAIYLGPGFYDLFGAPEDTFIGQRLSDLIHEDDLEQFRGLVAEALTGLDQRSEGQVRLRFPDGSYRRFLCSWRQIKQISGDMALFVSLRDISQRLIAQERLRAGEIRLRTMMENVADGILSMDQNGVIQSVNPAASRVFGYEGDELVGNGVSLLFPASLTLAFPSAAAATGERERLDQLVGRGEIEVKGQHKDGSVFPMDLAITEMRIADERCFVAVVRDISSRKQSEKRLYEALQEAEAANRTKSLFLANMSHELRTPLNAIIGFSEIMKGEMFGPIKNERYLDYMGNIHDSSRHLLAVINDILDISRIEAGELELDEDWVDIEEVLAWAKERAAPKSSEIKLAPVWIHATKDLPELYADQRSLRQIVLNLVSNALKFTSPEGRVDISARLDEMSAISIIVEDTGIGIPADQVDKMTLPFTQSDNSLSRRFEGTGLGLAITKSLVEAHGGRLKIESTEGKGTKITVRMPPDRVWSEAAERTKAALSRA